MDTYQRYTLPRQREAARTEISARLAGRPATTEQEAIMSTAPDDMTERQLAAEAERRALIMQAVREHESNVMTEIRRFHAELDHVNTVCDLRTAGQDQENPS